MARNRRTAKVVAVAAFTLPFLSSGLAGAAVTSPGASAVWHTGETHTITWDQLDGVAGSIDVSLYDANGQVDADPATQEMDDIATSLDSVADTSVEWTIPAGLVGTGRFIRVHGSAGLGGWTGTAVDSSTFDIDHPVPAITSPAAAAQWRVGSQKTITFVAPHGATGTASLSLYNGSGPVDLDEVTDGVQSTIATGLDVATATSASWTVPEAALGTGLFVRLEGDDGQSAWAGPAINSGTFSVIPSVGVHSPTTGDNWRMGETHSIDFVAPEGATGTAALALYNGATKVDADPNTAGTQNIAVGINVATTFTHSWVIPDGITPSNSMVIRLEGDAGQNEWTGTALNSDPFILRAGPPVPRFTVPAASARWHTGEAQTVTFVVPENSTGRADIYLLQNGTPVDADAVTAGVQPFADDVNVATTSTFAWTIPAGLSGTGFQFQLTAGAGATPRFAGSDILSGSFSIYPVGAAEARIVSKVDGRASLGEKVSVRWHDDGSTGPTVSIDLLRNDGGSGATTTPVVKDLAKSTVCNANTHECTYEWTVGEKTALDTSSGTYKLRITPVLGAAGKTGTFAIVDRSLSINEWSSHQNVVPGRAVVLSWTAAGNLGTLKIEAVPTANGAKPIVLESKYDASKETYTWYPGFAQTGNYTMRITSSVKDAAKAAITDSTFYVVVVTASNASLQVGTLTGPTNSAATLGQPITVSWGFGELVNAPKAYPLVDIALVDSNDKATKIATATRGDLAENGTPLRSFTYRATGKVKPGIYRLRVTVSGSTDAGLTGLSSQVNLTAPTALTLTAPAAAASVERGGMLTVAWSWNNKSELPVTINLLNTTTNKATALAKGVVGKAGNGAGTTSVAIPAKGLTAGSTYKIQVISDDLKTIKAEAAVVLTDPALAVTAPAGTGNNKVTMIKGASSPVSWTLGTTGAAIVKLDVIAAADRNATKPKVVATINAKAVTANGGGTVHFTPDAKIASGDYVVRATAADVSSTPAFSDTFAVASSAVASVTPPTGARVGDTVSIGWTLANEATDDVKIELFEGSTLVAKSGAISKKATATLGTGVFAWKIPATLPTGSGHQYTIKVTSLSDDTKTLTSSAFTVAAAS